MNPFKLLKLNYLFDPTPGYTFLYFWPLVVLFILTFAGSFFIRKKFKNLPTHIPTRIREFTILGIFLTFLRDQDIPYFAMRLWLVLFFALIPIYAIWSRLSFLKKLEEEAKITHKTEILDKYLPTPKKKRKKK